MNTRYIGLRFIVFVLLAALVLSACSGQPLASTVVPTVVAAVPLTGQQAATPTLAAVPATAAQTSATSIQATSASTQAATLQPTAVQSTAAACTSSAALTPAVTEGPYFKAGSPERASLIASGITGITLTLTGVVMTADCQPVSHALLDFWQANAQGQYDNAGYTLRGHQYTDANGRFQLVTVVPGLYPGRTEHIHVKVQAPGGPVLTTQLFFPGVTDNSSDGIFNQTLLVQIQANNANTMQATFTFFVNSK